jgi:hypothetical protein
MRFTAAVGLVYPIGAVIFKADGRREIFGNDK